MNSVNVTVVIKSLGLGGAERLLVDALPYMDRGRFSYRYAYVTPWKRTLVPAIEGEGFEVTCLGRNYASAVSPASTIYTPARSLKALTLLPTALESLRRLMRDTACDLLQADLPIAGILARMAGRQMGVPVAYTEHNLQERYHPATRWANRITYGWNDVVFAVSEKVAASIHRNGLVENRRGRPDVRTLPNGVPVETVRAKATELDRLRRELAIPFDRPLVGAVAVFRPQKRLLDWLEVARKVAQTHSDSLFLIVGDGPDMPAVRDRVNEIGLADRVYLPGFRVDGRRLMALMDVFLMTSEFEGLPIAMLEAMALGKPIVATAVGGIPEVIASGSEGMLAGVGEVDMLAAQVSAILANPRAAAEMGDAATIKVERHYHTRHRVAAMESTYLELVH